MSSCPDAKSGPEPPYIHAEEKLRDSCADFALCLIAQLWDGSLQPKLPQAGDPARTRRNLLGLVTREAIRHLSHVKKLSPKKYADLRQPLFCLRTPPETS